MKKLPKEFIGVGEVRGFLFKLIDENKNSYIYEVTVNDSKHYEVIKKVFNKRFNCESYPSSKSFGRFGWCYSKYEQALLKFSTFNE